MIVPYRIIYDPAAEAHFRALTARQQSMILDTVEKQLVDQPAVETRNRKRMRPNSIAPWELRIGVLRVFYDVSEEPEAVVSILAVGIKNRNRVIIAGEEVEP